MRRNRISMQGCFPPPPCKFKFLEIDFSIRSFLLELPEPIVLLVNGKRKSIDYWTLRDWIEDHPNNKQLLLAQKAHDIEIKLNKWESFLEDAA